MRRLFSHFVKILTWWRHNGIVNDFICGTLTPSGLWYISSNWHMMFFLAHDIVLDCRSAFSVYFFNPIWPTKTAKMTVRIKTRVKQKAKHRFVLVSSRWWRIWPYFFTSVVLISNKVTEKTLKIVILSLFYNTTKCTELIKKHTKNHIIFFRRVGIYIV